MDYTFESALADVVDNSIAANAKKITVSISSGKPDSKFNQPYVLICDDGAGMSEESLVAAMQYASETDNADELNLGRFGLGMKTASLSQADRLFVATRRTKSSHLFIRGWDLDYLQSKEVNGQWYLLEGKVSHFPRLAGDSLRNSRGTVVFWSHLNRLIPDLEELNRTQLDKRMNEFVLRAMNHLSLTFNRFLAGIARNRTGTRNRRVDIWVNGNKLTPWDPFLVDHKATIKDGERTFSFKASGGGFVNLSFKAHILPRQDKFNSPEDFHRAGLIRKWNASQGIYVYRVDRLVKPGGWFRLRSNDEHCKLSRISLDIDRSADDALNLNVQKSTIMLPSDIRSVVKTWVAERAKRARNVYDTGNPEGARKRATVKGKASKKGKKVTISRGRKGKKIPPRKVTLREKEVLLNLWQECESDSDRRALVRVCRRAFPGFDFPRNNGGTT